MANVIPKKVKRDIVDGYAAETLYACLLTNLFPNTPGAYDVYGDLTNEVPNGSGYATEGKILAGAAGSYVDTYNGKLDATDVAWTSATFANVRFVAVYDYTSKDIRAIYDLGADKSVTAGTFTVEWNTSGLMKVSSP